MVSSPGTKTEGPPLPAPMLPQTQGPSEDWSRKGQDPRVKKTFPEAFPHLPPTVRIRGTASCLTITIACQVRKLRLGDGKRPSTDEQWPWVWKPLPRTRELTQATKSTTLLSSRVSSSATQGRSPRPQPHTVGREPRSHRPCVTCQLSSPEMGQKGKVSLAASSTPGGKRPPYP